MGFHSPQNLVVDAAAYGVSSLITEDLSMAIGMIMLIMFHVLWYFYASLTIKTGYDRILRLNSDWGIIYKEIDTGSFLIQKVFGGVGFA